MRSRNIKPGFFENEDLAELPPLARLLFAGLWCYADREGRFEWRPKKIKACILPYDKDGVSGHLDALTVNGFIRKYEVDGKEYGQVVHFLDHQKPHPHEARSKIPEYNQCHDMVYQSNDKVLQCNSDIMILGYSDIRNEDSAPSNKNCSEPPVITLPLVDKSEYGITEADVAEWSKTFPGLDILQRVRVMREWLISNPTRQKTSRGIRRFVTSWLDRDQNKIGGRAIKKPDAVEDWEPPDLSKPQW